MLMLKSVSSEPVPKVVSDVPNDEQTIATRAHCCMPRLSGIENLSVITHFRFLPESITATVHKHIAPRREGHYSDDSAGFEDLERSAATSEKSLIETERVAESESLSHSEKVKVVAKAVVLVEDVTGSCIVRKSTTHMRSLLNRLLQILRIKNNNVAPCG
jgi:hypothetical protein